MVQVAKSGHRASSWTVREGSAVSAAPGGLIKGKIRVVMSQPIL